LLTLSPAFNGADRQEVLSRVASSEPVSPRKLERFVPRDLETVVLKAMEKDPARRYSTAKELADDLRRFLSHEPVRAKRATLPQRAHKWGRRHPAVVRSGAVALALVAAGSSLAAWLVWQAKDRTARALAAETVERQRADAETRIARERDAETAALLKFFEERVLAPARPEGLEGGLGHDVKLRHAIEAALPAVDREFADKPLLQARLRRTIGLSFKYLGEAKAAVEQFELARALYATHRGPDHPDTLAVVNNLASGYEALGRQDDALRLREETLALRRARLGPDHPDTLASETNLASSYERLGRHDDALKLREETLRSTRARLGPDHADTLRGMNNLGISYTVLGRHEKAREIHEAALPLMKAQFGADHPNTLACRHNLAESYHALGRCGDALRLYEGTLELAKVKLPPDHEKTLLVMNNLAWLLATAQDDKVRDPGRAVELAERAARLSADNADYRGTLGTARYRTGDCQQAARDLETAIRLRGPDDPASANEAFVLAMACRRLGDGPAARAWFAKAEAWLAKAKTRTDEMRRFRAEAAKLLGLGDGPPE
jgi:tetratricopeptide (TPR) repeat protein